MSHLSQVAKAVRSSLLHYSAGRLWPGAG